MTSVFSIIFPYSAHLNKDQKASKERGGNKKGLKVRQN